jgi:hypothetical protein
MAGDKSVLENESDALAVHAENARWLIERETNRIESFHQRAATLLGFTGVILAILPSSLDPIQKVSNQTLKLADWAIALSSATTLAIGAASSLLVILVKKTGDLDYEALVTKWIETSSSPLRPGQVQADYVNAYFGRKLTISDSTLLSLGSQGHSKAQALRLAMWSSTAGIVLLGALLATLLANRIWP